MQDEAAQDGLRKADDIEQRPAGSGLLNALSDYGASEVAMRRRMRGSMNLGETDLLALRYVIEADAANRPIGPKELGQKLGVTSASMTALIDRLVKSGHVSREPHPSDRRALLLRPAPGSSKEVRGLMDLTHRRMAEIASSLSPEDSKTVADFLQRMRGTVDAIDPTNQD
ncbi:DNA-binding transcriptional regulator, MarR family [Arthrobacter crystallopoietes]|uniref:DNA-binding transcriptional regulator, MarR family n=2 Tax=Crystallibacter crystallopoietes TaxID=37928 RepID=A0A1H0ZPN4_9MICC|nr:MarR family transcriptional regulator [Arthrobacter crystallopoietes]SDQ29309.1 DNA-binding transcriptional regulator, MarR family [Arthrobacter crystallopoietes]